MAVLLGNVTSGALRNHHLRFRAPLARLPARACQACSSGPRPMPSPAPFLVPRRRPEGEDGETTRRGAPWFRLVSRAPSRRLLILRNGWLVGSSKYLGR